MPMRETTYEKQVPRSSANLRQIDALPELLCAEARSVPAHFQREASVRFKLISSILLSASMVAAPVAASAAGSASKLSVVGARAGASTSGGNELGEGAGGIVALALLAGIAAILIVGELAGDDNDSVSA